MTDPVEVAVDCYAGHRADELPRRFRLGGRTLEVRRILDRWLTPDHRCFKVEADDGGIHVLRCDVARGRWEWVCPATRSRSSTSATDPRTTGS